MSHDVEIDKLVKYTCKNFKSLIYALKHHNSHYRTIFKVHILSSKLIRMANDNQHVCL